MTDMHREFERKSCSAYTASTHSCSNGFPVLSGICYGCSGGTPLCMRDDVPEHLMSDDGHPLNWQSAMRYRDEQEKQA